MKHILKRDTIGTLKIRHKKSRNYGNAANQFLFPLGNDTANVMYNIETTHNCVNKSVNGGDIRIPIASNHFGIGSNTNAFTLDSDNKFDNGNRDTINSNADVANDSQSTNLLENIKAATRTIESKRKICMFILTSTKFEFSTLTTNFLINKTA